MLPKYIPLLRPRTNKNLADFIIETIELGKGYEAGERAREKAEQAKPSVEIRAIEDPKTEASRKELEEIKIQIAAMDTRRYSSRYNYDRSRSRSKNNGNSSKSG